MLRGLPESRTSHIYFAVEAARVRSPMEFTAEQAWSRILEGVRAQIPEQSYRTWLAPTAAVALSDDALVVAAPSDFASEWIEDKYGPLLTRHAGALFGESFQLTFQVQPNGGEAPSLFAEIAGPELTELPGPPRPEHHEQAPSTMGLLNPRYTLDRFVVGNNNEFPAAAIQAAAAEPGRVYNPLCIHGGVGLGKTHLMHALGHAVLEFFPGLRVAYVPSEQFTNELIESIRTRSGETFRRRYRRVDVLLIDDVHFLADKEATQEEFFHTFNALYNAQKQIVLTSDRHPNEIPGLQDRLVSRFEWGLVTDVKRPDFETRLAILHLKAEADGLSLGHDVLSYIATHCRSSVRALEGALIKLLAYSSLTKRALTVDLATEVLRAAPEPRTTVSPAEIQAAVGRAFGVSVAALHSRARSRLVAQPRQVAMYLTKTILDVPYTHIGHLFGGRDHSTVIHSIRRVESRMSSEPAFREQLQTLIASLRC